MISIATVGYGDFAPQTAFGKLLVMWEVFWGLIFILIGLQRVITASMNDERDKPSQHRASQVDHCGAGI